MYFLPQTEHCCVLIVLDSTTILTGFHSVDVLLYTILLLRLFWKLRSALLGHPN